MQDSILKFHEQFNYQPEIIGDLDLTEVKHFMVGGMGGSHLSAGLLQMLLPEKEIYIHRDYALPRYSPDFLSESLFIASSYSGNTEETLDFADEAYSRGYKVCVITTGGKLLDFAKENNIPYIMIPNTGIQPRTALGFSILAMSAIIHPSFVPIIAESGKNIDPNIMSDQAKNLSTEIQNKIPVIYTSRANRHLGYNWKIKMNETAKVPAFNNSFPELNHNEMQGYDSPMSENFHFIFLRDENDGPDIEKRMNVLEELFQNKGLGVTSVTIQGLNPVEKIFYNLILADLTSINLANFNGVEPQAVPLIEEFKKKLK